VVFLAAGLHGHALAGIILTVVSLAHAWRHRTWPKAALAGKLKGSYRVKVIMSTVSILGLLLACFSGPAAMAGAGAKVFHGVVGSITLAGLFVHALGHVRRPARTRKKQLGKPIPGEVLQ